VFAVCMLLGCAVAAAGRGTGRPGAARTATGTRPKRICRCIEYHGERPLESRAARRGETPRPSSRGSASLSRRRPRKADWPPKARRRAGVRTTAGRPLLRRRTTRQGPLEGRDDLQGKRIDAPHQSPSAQASPVTDGETGGRHARLRRGRCATTSTARSCGGNRTWAKPRTDLGARLVADPVPRPGPSSGAGRAKRQFLRAVNKKTGEKCLGGTPNRAALTAPNRASWLGSWCTPLVIRVDDHDELIVARTGKPHGFSIRKRVRNFVVRWALGPLAYASPVSMPTGG